MNQSWKLDKQYIAIIKPLLDSPDVQRLRQYVHHKNNTRLDHVLQVSYKSYKLGLKLHLNAVALARAGVLHDLYFIQGHYRINHHGHAYWHPKIACANAEKITHLSDLEKDIILTHMYGAVLIKPHYKESWLLGLIDDWQAIQDVIPKRKFLKWFRLQSQIKF